MTAGAVLRAAGLFLGAAALLLLASSPTIGVYDEGLVLTGALRVLHGEWPSRDFYANYAPAQFVLLAGVFALARVDSLAARLLDAAQMGGIVLAAWLLLRRLAPTPWAVGGTLAVLLLLTTTRSELWPINPSILLVLCLVLVLVPRLAEGRGLAPCWPAALLLVALLLTRYDLMPKVLLGVGLPALLVLALRRRARLVEAGAVRRILLSNAVLLGLLGGAALAGLWAAGILGPALHDILTYNVANYVAMRDLPFPGAETIRGRPREALVYLAPLALAVAAAALAGLARAARGGVSRDPRAIALLLLAGVTATLFTKGLVRTEALHMLAANVPALLLLATGGAVLAAPLEARCPAALRRGCALVALAAGLVALSTLLLARGAPDTLRRLVAAEPGLPGLGVFPAGPERMEAARYVAAITAPGERILSATGRHDKVFVNDIAFYVAAGRLPGTRWHHYDPGVQTSEAVQRAMIAELDRLPVRVVMRDRSFDEVGEPNRSALSSGVTLLDAHLAAHFVPEATFGPITILRRRDAPGP